MTLKLKSVISDRRIRKGSAPKEGEAASLQSCQYTKKEGNFMWTTCANCVENNNVGITGNLVMVVGNSPLPATLQAVEQA